jgi:hypothetical protein
MNRWLDGWQRYWFTEIDPHSYALMRIGLGVVGILGLIGLTPVAMYWPTDALTPVPGGGFGLRSALVDAGIAAPIGYVLYAVLWIAFGCMVVGFRTSSAVALCFVASAAQGFWNPLPLSSSHKVLVSLLFCLVWADCGRVLSVDAWRNGASQAGGGLTGDIWPLRLARVQIALIYLSSGVTKLFGELWRDGTALHYVLQLNAFHRFPVTLPLSAEGLLTTLTYLTLLWELGFVFLIFNRRTRSAVLWFGVMMHLGMAFALELGTFSAAMLVGYIAFLDPAIASKYVNWLTGRFSAEPERSPV